jgi:polygalacturonase
MRMARRLARVLLAAVLAAPAGCGVFSGKPAAKAASFACSATGSAATGAVAVTGLQAGNSGNDDPAIQRAINAAGGRGGGVVALPAGTFTLDGPLVLRDNVELIGAGPATVLKAGPRFLATQGPGGGYPLITTDGAANTTVADVTADQSGNTLDGNTLGRLAGYVVEGWNSRNVMITGVHVRNPFTYSIAMVNSTDFCIRDSSVDVTDAGQYNQLDGIHILDSSFGQVIYNRVRSGDDGLVAHTISGPVHDVLYAGNTVRGGAAADGMQLAVGNYPIYNITIEDNNFSGSLFGIRTGYYDKRTGSVGNVVISGNYIHGLTQGSSYPAIQIGGFGGRGQITGVTITGNRVCAAGSVGVQPGPGNSAVQTAGCPQARNG